MLRVVVSEEHKHKECEYVDASRKDSDEGVGIIGGVIGLFINIPFPYGSITYNFAISNTFIGVLAAGIYIFAFLVLMFFGHYNTKHTDMR